MSNRIDASIFGLSSRVELREIDGIIQIVKQRKSRIIMKDAAKILEITSKIRTINPEKSIQLLVSGPICSKSLKFLAENDVLVVFN